MSEQINETPMPLSAAIRIGAAKRPQGFGPHILRPARNTSCVMQAAGEGLSGEQCKDELSAYQLLKESGFDTCSIYLSGCPACTDKDKRLWGICTHLNDDHKWERERIADFLAQQGY